MSRLRAFQSTSTSQRVDVVARWDVVVGSEAAGVTDVHRRKPADVLALPPALNLDQLGRVEASDDVFNLQEEM